jgi:hypothetical protein
MGGGKAEGCKKGIYAMTAPEYKDLNLSFSEMYCGDVFYLFVNKARLLVHEGVKKQVQILRHTDKGNAPARRS